MSKQILKDDPTNLEIWKFYSYFVRDSANGIEKAIKVLTTTISMLHKLPKDSLKEAAKIYGSLAEAYLITKNFQKCIESLVAFTACSDLKAVNSSEIENARRSYQNMLDVAADIQNLDSLKDIFFNYCLLELLTTPLEGAGKPLYGVANAIPPNTVANELFHETILYSVLLFVSASGVNQSRVIKEVLYSCLNHYPNNVMFLSAYVATQSQVQIKHQLRRALKEMLDTNPSELLWLFLIWTEQQGSKNLNVVRATFDEALKQSGKIGIQLFVMAIRFEVYCNDFQRAKRIFYHAISEYPWAKELYMLAFRDLEAVLSGDEVNELIQSMEEKEIRFRIPFGG